MESTNQQISTPSNSSIPVESQGLLVVPEGTNSTPQIPPTSDVNKDDTISGNGVRLDVPSKDGADAQSLSSLQSAPPSAWNLHRASSFVTGSEAGLSGVSKDKSSSNMYLAGPIDGENALVVDDADREDTTTPTQRGGRRSSNVGGSMIRRRSSSAKKALGSAIGSIKRHMGFGKRASHSPEKRDRNEVSVETGERSESRSPEGRVEESTNSLNKPEVPTASSSQHSDTGGADGIKRRPSFRESIRAKRESFRRLGRKTPAPDTFAFGSVTRFPQKHRDEGMEDEVDRDALQGANASTALFASPTDITDDDPAGVHNTISNGGIDQVEKVLYPGSLRPPVRHTVSAPASSGASSLHSGKSKSPKHAMSVLPSSHDARQLRTDHDRPTKLPTPSLLATSSPRSKSPELENLNSFAQKATISDQSGHNESLEALEVIHDLEDMAIPDKWINGSIMLKVADREAKRRGVRLDPEQGLLLWEAKKGGIIMVQNIKEIRTGPDTRFYREQFKQPVEFEDRWLTISYLVDGKYKTLHLVALTQDDFRSFYRALVRLRALRAALLSLPAPPELTMPAENPDFKLIPSSPITHSGPEHKHHHLPRISTGISRHRRSHSQRSSKSHGNHGPQRNLTQEQQQTLWERHQWKAADMSGDRRLDFKEVERMAHKLSLGIGHAELRRLFDEVDVSGNGSLDFEEFRLFWKQRRYRRELVHLFKKLMSGDEQLPVGRKVDDGVEGLTREVFAKFIREQQKEKRSSDDIESLFLRYATEVSQPEAHKGKASQSTTPSTPTHVITLEGFTMYLMSSDNSAFTDQHLGVYQDMTRPLPEYYISSSHNTYLVGHQLIGESTIEGYIRVLLNSCRSVEIDIWDGDKEPVITHGGTLTSKVPLRAICEVIAKNAFSTSCYPVIISAEVHCGVQQQDKIAEIMKECFGDMLVDRRLDSSPIDEALESLPSPEMLKYKILLKTKNPLLSRASSNMVDIKSDVTGAIETDGGTETAITSDPESYPRERGGSFSIRKGRRRSSISFKPVPTSMPPEGNDYVMVGSPKNTMLALPGSPPADPPPKVKGFSMALASLLIYTVGVKCRGINKKETYAVEHMFSLSEKKVDKMLKQGSLYYSGVTEEDGEHPAHDAWGGMLDLIKHSQTHLVRIYPKGTRLSSTNYLPHRYWAAGAQLVALNWQTSDLGSMINHTMFQRNGKSGYVLKPACLRWKDKKTKDLITARKSYNLRIKVISGQQIPRPRDKDGREIVDRSTMDPYVQIAVYVPDWPGGSEKQFSVTSSGDVQQVAASSSPPRTTNPMRRLSTDATIMPKSSYVLQPGSTPAEVVRKQTSIVKNNGFNPIWDEQLDMKFEVAGDMLDLVFIRFLVRDEDDDEDDQPLAMHCASLGSLKQGYRHLPLHDQQMSQYLFATLFVHIDLQELSP